MLIIQKTIVDGELKAYSQMLNEKKQLVTERMIKEPDDYGADEKVYIIYCYAGKSGNIIVWDQQ